jgi:Rho-binding antiterminator
MLSCHDYDAIEILCMHHYPINITMKTGCVIKCVALDTFINEFRQECIKVELNTHYSQENKMIDLVVLNDISNIEICIENPHFQHLPLI